LKDEREGSFSKLAWKVRPTETLKLQSVRILDGKFVSLSSGSRQRLMAMMRVRLTDSPEEAKLDYAGTMRIALQQQRMKGLFDGLYRAEVPFLYVSMMVPSPNQDPEKEVFEFDLVVGTWVDAKGKETERAMQDLEQRASVLAATTSVALPSAQVRRLCRSELRDFVKSLFLPTDPDLPQVGSASVVSTLESFDGRSPMTGTADHAPLFYISNAAESGKSGILIGKVKSSGGEFHDFYLQLDDLRRHIAILGMTGSGKSTTAATVVKQVAEMGLPALVLDWHNEYGSIISKVGGRVVSPGKDDFAINPIESSFSSDPIEHIAMVTDIFSDIYHFTHPQAYMFRNALQKKVAESG